LDEVITLVRKQLAGGVLGLGAGHRAWVTPVVYWRCRDRVFEIDATRVEPDDAVLQELRSIDVQLDNYARTLRDLGTEIARQQPEVRIMLTSSPLRLGIIAEVERLLSEKQALLGESVRLQGGRAVAGQEIACRLTIKLAAPGMVSLVRLRIGYPGDKLTFLDAANGADAPAATAPLGPGRQEVVLINPSEHAPWEPGDHELAVLRFSVAQDAEPSLLDVQIQRAVVTHHQDSVPFRTVDGIVLVEEGTSPGHHAGPQGEPAPINEPSPQPDTTSAAPGMPLEPERLERKARENGVIHTTQPLEPEHVSGLGAAGDPAKDHALLARDTLGRLGPLSLRQAINVLTAQIQQVSKAILGPGQPAAPFSEIDDARKALKAVPTAANRAVPHVSVGEVDGICENIARHLDELESSASKSTQARRALDDLLKELGSLRRATSQ
jgi:hypothetical protein